MPIVLDILAAGLIVLAGAGMLYWAVVFYRVVIGMRVRPTIRAGTSLPVPPGSPLVSIVIPAHNEERVIDACCTSLRAQTYENLQIIFVLDRCTDRTLELLRPHAEADDRVTIIENDDCPPDWAGKCNAARIGAERAEGAWLLFSDADTTFAPDLVRTSVALAHDRDYSLLSLLSTLTYHHHFERIAQPVATMSLIRLYPIHRVRKGQPTRALANGQFMLFRRDHYEEIDGHVGVKEALLEDLAFARRVREFGHTTGVVLADGMLTCSMYDSLEAFHTGWKRIFMEACRRKVSRLKTSGMRLIFGGIGLPIAQVLALVAAWGAGWFDTTGGAASVIGIVGAGWLLQFVALSIIYRASGAPLWAILYYPVGCWLVARTMREGADDLTHRRPVRWGGKEYILEPR